MPFCKAQFRRICQERDQIFLRNHIVFVLLSFHEDLNFWRSTIFLKCIRNKLTKKTFSLATRRNFISPPKYADGLSFAQICCQSAIKPTFTINAILRESTVKLSGRIDFCRASVARCNCPPQSARVIQAIRRFGRISRPVCLLRRKQRFHPLFHSP